MYVLTSVDLIPAALRQKTLDFTPFIIEYARSTLKISSAGMQVISSDYMKDVHNAMHESMQPGPGLRDMNIRVLEALVQHINEIKPSWESRKLYQWFRDIFTISSSRALYGSNDVITRNANMIEDLWIWEEDQALLAALPFAAKDADTARERSQAAFVEYYENGWDKDASALVRSRNRVARKWGMNLQDIAKSELSILYVTTTNAMPSAFWLLCYILADTTLHANILTELEAIATIRRTKDQAIEGRIDISKFDGGTPLLMSCYHETLRLQNAQVSVRKVMEDTVLTSPSTGRDYLFKAGNTIHIPSGLTHAATSVWGTDASYFDARRFIRKDESIEKSKTARKLQNQAFFPFGGGKHLCPGRFFAQAEILGLVAVLLLGYEIVGENGNVQVPNARMQKFGVGVKKPENDVDVKIRKRVDRVGVRWRFATEQYDV